MSSWGERMTSMVTSCGPRGSSHHPGLPYHRRLEKVKFGVPLEQVCKRDIPGPLLVMLLKLNKEGPFKKDVFRAPGHQGNMRKLVHFLQNGRLVNIHSFSVNTIASVLKKFLRKIPGGVFGPENEAELFEIIKLEDTEEKIARVQRVFLSLPAYSQHLLVLLFGTFRVIHSNCEQAQTGMTAEALGVSVAPSFFHTCVAAGKTAKMEDVERFKLATKVTKFFIEHFGRRDLFGRDNYEYYARLTGRILKVEDEYIFFTYPPAIAGGGRGAAPRSADDTDASLDRLGRGRSESPGATGGVGGAGAGGGPPPGALEKTCTGSLEIIPENCPLDPAGRLSISLDDQNVSSPSSCGSPSALVGAGGGIAFAEMAIREETAARRSIASAATAVGAAAADPAAAGLRRNGGRGGVSAAAGGEIKSYTCLPQVHQKQTERMRHRSEWFLSDPSGLVTVKCRPASSSSSAAPAPTSAAAAETTTSPFATAPRRSATAATSLSSAASIPAHRLSTQSAAAPLSPFPAPPSPSSSATAVPVCDTSKPPSVALLTSSSVAVPFPTSPALHHHHLHLHHPSGRQQQQPSSGHHSLPPSSLPPPDSPQQHAASSSLRRRLSDKDKERRLVRRSSSKRKDKENGGGGKDSPCGSGRGSNRGSSSALESLGSGGHHQQAAALAAALEAAAGTGGAPGRPALKRAGSADAHPHLRGSSGSLVAPPAATAAAAVSSQQHQQPSPSPHPALCRTGSQDTPHHHHHVMPPLQGPQPAAASSAASVGASAADGGGSGGGGGGSGQVSGHSSQTRLAAAAAAGGTTGESGSESPLARSMPRI